MPLGLKTVIYSHLSDVQHMRDFEQIRMRVNFVKMLVSKLDNGVKEMTEDELNEIWADCNKRFGQ